MKVYMLHLQLNDESVMIAQGKDGKIAVATEENLHLLQEIGNRMIEDDIVIGYQIVGTEGSPVRKL